MSMPRITWGQLPAETRQAVLERTGSIYTIQTVTSGQNSAIAVRLQTHTGGVFVKGVPLAHPQIRAQQREADVNPYLPASSPRLLWHVQAGGWDLLGFELLRGVHADFRRGSVDLPKVVEALNLLGTTVCAKPFLARVDERWANFTPPSALPELRGIHLLHTDLAPRNILVDDDRAHLIDWAWPARGPAWVDPAIWIIHLIDAGHTPAEAENWAAHVSVWHRGSRTAIDVFAHANAALWAEIAAHDSSEWKKRLADSARQWSEYRRHGGIEHHSAGQSPGDADV